MSGITKDFEHLYNEKGSIKSRCFYCDITKSDYEILGSVAILNQKNKIIDMNHKVKRLKDNATKIFNESDLKSRFKKVRLKKC